MQPLLDLEQAYRAARARRALPSPAARAALHVRGPAHAALLRGAPHPPRGRRPHLPQARGSLPHRRPQDQQRAGPGPARRSAWASRAWSPRPARASTGWPPPPRPRCSGLACEVYMGRVDVERQALNVFRMKLLGAKVIPVESGSKTLKDAVNEALRDWVTNVGTHLLPARLGDGPAPVPDDGARLPPGDRRGGAGAVAPGHRPAARICWSPAWAAAPTRSASSGPSSATGACASWASSRAGTASRAASTAPRSARARSGYCTGA